MVDTHLGESSGGVASGGDGGFLQHDAYLWMWWFGVCLDRWDGCCEWNWLSGRSEEHTSELQSLMRISYAVFCLTKKKQKKKQDDPNANSLNHIITTERV